mmetsp:Transcript_2909/g.7936  ORF Transcript_2909/g.7936 Transcript_2909/m.7936 type:complete len:307 (+) Transcript_2909:1964-2884(+)
MSTDKTDSLGSRSPSSSSHCCSNRLVSNKTRIEGVASSPGEASQTMTWPLVDTVTTNPISLPEWFGTAFIATMGVAWTDGISKDSVPLGTKPPFSGCGPRCHPRIVVGAPLAMVHSILAAGRGKTSTIAKGASSGAGAGADGNADAVPGISARSSKGEADWSDPASPPSLLSSRCCNDVPTIIPPSSVALAASLFSKYVVIERPFTMEVASLSDAKGGEEEDDDDDGDDRISICNQQRLPSERPTTRRTASSSPSPSFLHPGRRSTPPKQARGRGRAGRSCETSCRILGTIIIGCNDNNMMLYFVL